MTDVLTRIEDALASIISDWPDLTQVTVTSGIVAGGGNETQLPGGTQRLTLIAEAHTLVTQWTLLVLDERDLAGRVGDDTPDRADYLLEHADWLAGHDAGPDAATELTALAARIRSLVAPSGVRRIPIGACPGVDCPGVVHATLRDGESVATAGNQLPDLVCDLDRDHAWPEPQYRHLARMLGCDGPERLTAREMAEHLSQRFRRDVPVATVRTWIHRHPITVGWDADTGTVDRVRTTAHYLDTRTRRAA